MPRSRVYKTEAIVLRHQNLGDADKIVTVYSPYLGKLRLVGKGVLKPRSRVGGHVRAAVPGSRCSLHGVQTWTSSARSAPSRALSSCGMTLHRTAQALYAAELIDLFTGEEDASPELYEAPFGNTKGPHTQQGRRLGPASLRAASSGNSRLRARPRFLRSVPGLELPGWRILQLRRRRPRLPRLRRGRWSGAAYLSGRP